MIATTIIVVLCVVYAVVKEIREVHDPCKWSVSTSSSVRRLQHLISAPGREILWRRSLIASCACAIGVVGVAYRRLPTALEFVGMCTACFVIIYVVMTVCQLRFAGLLEKWGNYHVRALRRVLRGTRTCNERASLPNRNVGEAGF